MTKRGILHSDQSESILSSLYSVQMTILYGTVLVILVLGLFLSKTRTSKNIIKLLLSFLLINLTVFYFLGIPLESSRWIVLSVLAILILVGLLWRRDIILSFVVVFSIPVSLFITLIFMYLEKFTLNVISLSGLVLGIGLLVDNSIVVLENFDLIRQKFKAKSFKEQIELAAKQMASPMIGGTLTTIVVFLPFFLLQKQAQLMYAGIAFTVITSLLASLFSALFLLSFLTSKLVGYENIKEKYKSRIQGSINKPLKIISRITVILKSFYLILSSSKLITFILIGIFFTVISFLVFKLTKRVDLTAFIVSVIGILLLGAFKFKDYHTSLVWAIDKRKIIVSLILFLFIAAIFVFIFRLPKDFMASREENEFIVFVELTSGIKLDICDEIVKEVETTIQEIPEVKDMIKSVSSRVEGWSSKVYVSLVSSAKRDLSTKQVIDKLRPKLENIGQEYDTFIHFSEAKKGKEIFVEIYGDNYKTLSDLSMQIASLMGKVSAFSDEKIRYRPGQSEMSIKLDPKRVKILGTDNKAIADSLHAQIRGVRATSFYDEGEEIETILRLKPDQRKTLEQVKGLSFKNSWGGVYSCSACCKYGNQ
ncbi:MAG: efflux RND transporter permease subunit [bacterium]|nr:efflux RND transporter permease subunit [bacterium]